MASGSRDYHRRVDGAQKYVGDLRDTKETLHSPKYVIILRVVSAVALVSSVVALASLVYDFAKGSESERVSESVLVEKLE